MSATWQILSNGTDQQRRDAMAVLIETRRRLYGLLADEDPHAEDHLDGHADRHLDGYGERGGR